MILDSYEKAALDVLEQFKSSSLIFVISGLPLKMVISLAIGDLNLFAHRAELYNFNSLQVVDITKVIPDILTKIQAAVPFPEEKQRKVLTSTQQISQDFVIEFISQYGISWVPVESHIYQFTLNNSALDNPNMEDWQKYIRADLSLDKDELIYLLTDASSKVRSRALKRFKTKLQ